METKDLFTILGCIPQDQVINYKVEYIQEVNKDEEGVFSTFRITEVADLDKFFLGFYNNHKYSILRCFIYFHKDSFIEVDILGKSIYIKNKSIDFPFFDTLQKKDIVGKARSIDTIKWV